MRYVLIGAGVAGIAAIEAIRSLDKTGEITIISDDPHGYYSRPGLAYYLTGEISDRALYPRTQDDYQKLNFKYLKSRVTSVFPLEHSLVLQENSKLKYDKLLIAVGASTLPLKVHGAGLDGVVKLDHMTDAKHILKLAKSGRTAVVIGGGITALELTEGLLARRMKVHYLLRGDRYWSNVLDPHESRLVEGRLRAHGAQIHYQAELNEIIGKKDRVSEVHLEDGRTIKCDMVAYAIGVRPRLELVQNTDLKLDRGILVNEHLQTSDPDIFAAGDVAQVYDPLSGQSVLDSLWSPAREQGRIAGLNMAGRRKAYLKSAAYNVTRLAGLTTTIIGAVGQGRDEDLTGIARGDSETWRNLPDAIMAQSGFDLNHLRLVIGEKTLLGAIVMGDQTLSGPLQKMVVGGADISSIRDRLMQANAPIADLIADFWMTWRRKSVSLPEDS